MTYFQAYLLTRLDALGGFFTLMAVMGGVASLLICIGFAEAYNASEYFENYVKKWWKFSIPIFFTGVLGVTVTPTTQQAAFIYIAPAMVNNKGVQESIKKIPELSNLGLQYLAETLKEEVENKKNKK